MDKNKNDRIVFYSTAKTEREALRDIENQMLEYQQKFEQGKIFNEVAELRKMNMMIYILKYKVLVGLENIDVAKLQRKLVENNCNIGQGFRKIAALEDTDYSRFDERFVESNG